MIPLEPVRGSFAYPDHPWLFGLSGLDQFRAFMKGQVPSLDELLRPATVESATINAREVATTTIDEAPADAHA
ncbi:MAG TPA: hypothetical protein VGB51_09835 [Actinomycetota bacterium]